MCTTRFGHAVLLLNTYINIFLFIDKSNLCNYPNNNALYTWGKDLNTVPCKLHQDFKISTWFYQTFMVLNPDKCNFFNSGIPGYKTGFCLLKY